MKDPGNGGGCKLDGWAGAREKGMRSEGSMSSSIRGTSMTNEMWSEGIQMQVIKKEMSDRGWP